MPRTLILRYSDYEVDTISAHLDIIRKARNPVWWGWWKKRHELMQSTALADIKKRCPVQIGLVNRTAQEFYTARCTNIAFSPEGQPIKSPKPQQTPPYYRKSSHPAWFEFSSIESLAHKLFEKEFGEVPKGDPTLFLVEENGLGTNVVPDLSVATSDVIATGGESILHLSDLHFGDDHGFTKQDQNDPVVELALASIIANRTKTLLNTRIGVVVVSGDLITRGITDGYVYADAFLNSLLQQLEIGKENVVIVPGNHDIWLKDNKHPTRDYQPEEPFRLFLRGFYGKPLTEIERQWIFRTSAGWHLSFLGLNSARPRRKETMDYGYVGWDRYEPWLRRISESNSGKTVSQLTREKRLNFAVLHHHLLPAGLVCKPEVNRPVSLTLDAGQLVADLQASAIHFVLHGHQHIPFVGSTGRARSVQNKWIGHEEPLFVIGAGSSGAKVDRLWDEMRNNTFGIYTPQQNGLHVRMEEYNQGLKPRTFMDFMVPFSLWSPSGGRNRSETAKT